MAQELMVVAVDSYDHVELSDYVVVETLAGTFYVPVDEATFGKHGQGNQKDYASQRPLSPAERRVDFASIKHIFDHDAVEVDLKLRQVIKQARDSLVDLVKKQAVYPISAEFAQSVKLTTGQEFAKIVEDYLLMVWRKNRDLALNELPEEAGEKLGWVRRYHLPGEHDQEKHGNWADGQGTALSGQVTVEQTASNTGVTNYLQIVAKVRAMNKPADWEYSGVEDYLLKNGQFFNPPTNLPKQYKGGKAKQCYMNAYHLVNAHPDDLTYVEGVATVFNMPIDHAWAVDKNNSVIDPTWMGNKKISPPKGAVSYYGVKIDLDDVRRVIYSRKKYGVLHDQERRYPLIRGIEKLKKLTGNADTREYHLPGEHDQETHGNWAQGYPKTTDAETILTSSKGVDTLAQYTLPNGQLTPERKQLHEKVINRYISDHEDSRPAPGEQPTVYLMGGGGASGKSVMQAKMALPHLLSVDVDVVRTMLPEWDEELGAARGAGRPVNHLLGTYTHEESSIISKRIIDRAVADRYNLIIDGAGDSTMDKLRANIKRYKSNGAKLVANYVTVDYDEAYKRMRARGDVIGRYIPAAHLRAVHAEVSKVFPQAVREGLFDEFTVWDTTSSVPLGSGKFSPALKVASGKRSQITIHDQVAWQRFLDKGKGISPRQGEI